MNYLKLFSLCFLCALLLSCALFQGTPQKINLVYSGNLDGELEPCGCTAEGNMGGIKRRVSMIDQLRLADSQLVLLSSGGLLISEMAEDRLTSTYILKGLAALNYDAVGIQWRDLAFGEKFLDQYAIPFVSSNNPTQYFLQSVLIERDGVKFRYFHWLEPEQAPEGGNLTQLTEKVVQVSNLNRALKRAKRNGEITILGSYLSMDSAKENFELSAVDILLIESNYETYKQPIQLENTLVLQPGSRGMRLGKLALSLSGSKIKAWDHQVINLPKSVADAARMKEWYDSYNRDVKVAYEKSVVQRKAMKSGVSKFSGADSCKTCHVEQYNIWSESRHAEAFYALQDVNKAFDPACIICHTVGFNQAGGFIDPQSTPELQNVQCESCHGASRLHVSSQGEKPVSHFGWQKEKMCQQCHTHTHSPSFNVSSYWPKINHTTKTKFQSLQ